MTDPWLVQTQNSTDNTQKTTNLNENSESNKIHNENTENLEFEDNFTTEQTENIHQPLPDSEAYLQGLEKKLNKLRKEAKLVDQLVAKREDCMRTLLDNNSDTLGASEHDELNTPVSNGDSTVQELYRHLQPVQPVTVGETVHIVDYDQLVNDEADDKSVSSEENKQ